MTQPRRPTAATKSGRIEGVSLDGLCVFKGIPYAAPPVGPRRWQPPQPVEPWEGVRPADTFGTIAPQNPVDLQMLPQREPEPQDEDSLFLNVWTPGLDDARRPVMVWIHGGGFTIGSGSTVTYDGSMLARRGNTVIVTINYRLGPLGFLNLNEVTGGRIPATGNEGLLDQVAALEWVRDNIAAFGGDPDNVTIFGESAGGMSVGSLLAMPRARGLFHKAIPQSGATHIGNPVERARGIAERYMEILGVAANDVDGLMSQPVDRMLAASRDLAAAAVKPDWKLGGMPLQPVVGDDVLPSLPFEAIRNGAADGIPILVGTLLEEWKLFGVADTSLAQIDEAGLLRRCQRIMPAESVTSVVETYRKAREARGQSTMPGEVFMAIQTDRAFRVPALRLAEVHHSRGQGARVYLFTWESPLMGGILGACHALELGFVFGTMDPQFHGSGPAVDSLSRKTQDAWLAFARTGDPSCESLGEWPEYGDGLNTMLLGKECGVVQAPYDEERRALEALPDAIAGI
jgi:para-nitrobenzyl esterase